MVATARMKFASEARQDQFIVSLGNKVVKIIQELAES